MSNLIAAIIGGVGGALAVFGIVIYVLCFCKSRHSNRHSETGSSDASAVAELKRGGRPRSFTSPHVPESHNGAIQLTLEELEQATKNFDESNLIGYGSFGPVYKGLLHDGNVVAIKRRIGTLRQVIVEEVAFLSRIRHRNLVALLGYCQESGYQMLVFEHLPNGSICNHLYDTRNYSKTKLEFKQRLAIGLGAAKGLCHLHGEKPPILHGNFKTANVLVDENFIAKVADNGIRKILGRIEDAGPSSTPNVSYFHDPEVGREEIFCENNDVYSFGVFLLELLTGKEGLDIDTLGSNERLIQWVAMHLNSNDFVDRRLAGRFTTEGLKDFIKLILHCMRFPGTTRPKMERVVSELDRILEREITLTTVMGEGSTTVTLGSQLFSLE